MRVVTTEIEAARLRRAGRAASGRRAKMTEHTIELDEHRGMAAQKATALRRLLGEVEAQRAALASRQEELELQLFA